MNSPSIGSQETLEKSQLEHFLHGHPLLFFENVEEQLWCEICNKRIINGPTYGCKSCSFYVHKSCGELPKQVDCGVSTNTLHDDAHVLEIEVKAFGPNPLESKETPQKLVEHFSHPHSLILNISEPNGVILCDGCVMPISELFYSCDQCNFFLHRHCVELKEKIQHPLHEHELILVSAWDNRYLYLHRNGIKCYGCEFYCNGFMYICEKCQFFLDVGCSLLPDRLNLDISRHECHTCALTLIDMRKRHNINLFEVTRYGTECNACGLNCLNKFVCEGCNFNLDLQCASLPKLIPHQCPKHDWNLHPFELVYKAIEDGRSGKHYCDVCEEERNENHWFYYCQDCDYSSHPRCILGHDRIKYGSLHEIKDHPHCVRFLKTAKRNHTCIACSKPCEKKQPVYTCEECNAYFHISCASLV